ncbi:MAG: phosphate acyltransferase PlsX [Bacteroidales bacterium]|jgi:glycerol-3-phosphate acyltransferase PlsX|nr:phosphate acyltransferase PlsX [Bacteroidales bacterium]
MRIGLDAMGGDYAPKAAVNGAVLANKELDSNDRIVLFGKKDIIEKEILSLGAKVEDFEIVEADEVIQMHEKPIKALQSKPNSSISVGFRFLKEGKIDTFASAGSTGVMLVGTMYSVGVLEGIIRPTLAAIIPKADKGVSVLLDVGVNPDSKAEMLYQFGLLGSAYAQAIGIPNPKVGLLNIGEEDEKGNQQTQAAMLLMKGTKDYDFRGNCEPIELFENNFDVFVCDGFVGNLMMKHTEAFAKTMVKKGMINDFIMRFNYELYGGLPLLGANGVVIIGHGISNEKAIKTMVLQSKTIYTSKINEQIAKVLKKEA